MTSSGENARPARRALLALAAVIAWSAFGYALGYAKGLSTSPAAVPISRLLEVWQNAGPAMSDRLLIYLDQRLPDDDPQRRALLPSIAPAFIRLGLPDEALARLRAVSESARDTGLFTQSVANVSIAALAGGHTDVAQAAIDLIPADRRTSMAYESIAAHIAIGRAQAHVAEVAEAIDKAFGDNRLGADDPLLDEFAARVREVAAFPIDERRAYARIFSGSSERWLAQVTSWANGRPWILGRFGPDFVDYALNVDSAPIAVYLPPAIRSLVEAGEDLSEIRAWLDRAPPEPRLGCIRDFTDAVVARYRGHDPASARKILDENVVDNESCAPMSDIAAGERDAARRSLRAPGAARGDSSEKAVP
ncbi:hypothetical protein K8I61_16230 [bacterium]|nr:hypothetical protein [bacterium]